VRVQEINTTTEGRYIIVDRYTYGKINAAIYLHPVALSFLNIIVDQIWLKATIFGLLMHVSNISATEKFQPQLFRGCSKLLLLLLLSS
jgi:hypothetical protein